MNMKKMLDTVVKNNRTVLHKNCNKTDGIYAGILPEIKKECSCYFTKTKKLLGCTDHNKNIITNIIDTTT